MDEKVKLVYSKWILRLVNNSKKGKSRVKSHLGREREIRGRNIYEEVPFVAPLH